MCLRMNSPATSRVGNGGCPGPDATDRTEASGQETPIDLRRQPHQRMAKVDDLLQSGTETDRPGDRRAAGSWLSSDSESRRQRNHEPPKSGIPKRKKTATHTRLSCKIEYLLSSDHGDAFNRFRILHGRL